MKKLGKLMLLLMAMTVLFCMFAMQSSATTHSGSFGDTMNWSFDTETGVLNIVGTGSMKDFGPSNPAPWFNYGYMGEIKSAVIQNGITSIGANAFSSCRGITSVTLPNSVTSIAVSAFKGCVALETITIPENITEIAGYTFDGCKALTGITIPNGVTSIGASAFYDCDSLTEIDIPGSVTSIGDYALSDCDSLTGITIPKSVTSIGSSTFYDCDSLTSITVDSDNTVFSSADGAMFSKDQTQLLICPNGKSGNYTVPGSVTTIESRAFYNCKNLTSITIPVSVTSISDFVFYACGGLKYVFYGGAQELWDGIVTNYSFNESLTSAVIHYNSTGHSLDSGTITTAATCTTDGEKTYRCTATGCDVAETEPVAKKAHTPVTVKGKAATCTATGLTEGKKCSVCGTVTVAQKTVAKKAHTPVTVKGKAATCTATGLTEGKKCSVCGTVTVAQKSVAKKAHTYKTTTTKATTSKDGSTVKKCTVCGTQGGKTAIYKANSFKLSTGSYTYNGKAKTPSVTVKDSKGKTLKKDTDYTVKYASGRKNVGKYTVTVTLKGKYSGTKTLSFTINPKATGNISISQTTSSIKATWLKVSGATGYKVYLYKGSKLVSSKVVSSKTTSYSFTKLTAGTNYTVKVKTCQTVSKVDYWSSTKSLGAATNPATPSISSLKAGSKSATVKWSNVSGESGYQVYYATSKSGSYKKGATTKANDVDATIKSLTKGKTYYFKVRAYKTADSGTVYSAWSAVKSVKVK